MGEITVNGRDYVSIATMSFITGFFNGSFVAYSKANPGNLIFHVGVMSLVGGWIGYRSYSRDNEPEVEGNTLEDKLVIKEYVENSAAAIKGFANIAAIMSTAGNVLGYTSGYLAKNYF
ncbi:MAG: hypothetical protein U9R08_04970 [Nanoarchaeota archaeon]|nr:hypothetical protein [Nanoarchaeota archaeon]